MLGGGGQDAVGVGKGGGERFFDDAVDAALGSEDQRVGVLGVGGADADDVDTAGVEHGAGGVVVVGDVPLLGELGGAGGVHVGAGDDLGIGGERLEAGGVGVGDAAGADDPEAELGGHGSEEGSSGTGEEVVGERTGKTHKEDTLVSLGQER
jgi:hypothetical protein